MHNSLFVEVDELLSDEEQELGGLSMEEGWTERANCLAKIVNEYKKLRKYKTIIFAYPIAENLFKNMDLFNGCDEKLLHSLRRWIAGQTFLIDR